MKRAIDRPTGRRQKVFSRQEPMSCKFCRSKKLKCDRLIPCSNCTSRRIPCVSAVEGAVWYQPNQETGDSSPTTTNTGTRNDDLAQRVRKLEEAVFFKSSQALSMANPAQEGSHQTCPGTSVRQISFQDHVSSERSKRASVHIGPLSIAGDFEDSNETHTVAKSTGMNTAQPSSGFHFQCSTPHGSVESPDGYLLPGTSPSFYKPLTVAAMVGLLPSLPVARTLFSFYVHNVNWAQHIIHVPTTDRELEVLYKKLQNSVRPDYSQMALIVAILAVAAYFWPDTSTGKTTCPVDDPKAHCRKWILLVECALMEANHLTCPSIETLQAKLLLTQFLPTYPHGTGRTGHLALLIDQAYMLQLHRMDSPRQRMAQSKTAEDAVKLEIQRRVWWTIVIHDWMSFSNINRGQPGTYLIHPDHINVHYPSNVDDKDIVSNRNYDQPVLGSPTEMTFLIAKIHITKIVREFTDIANKAENSVDGLDYGSVLTFDKKINDAYDALPSYLRCDGADQSHLDALFRERPYLERQRRLLLFGLHNSLALLHRQFLVRSYLDSRYTYSRIECLRSTRIVIGMQKAVRQSFLGRTWLVIYHIFVAATTLTMDYVYNRDNPQVAAGKKREVLNCYRILEECGEQDPEVKHGLESLKRKMLERRELTEPSQTIVQDRLSPEELLSTETQTLSLPDSDMDVIPAQPQQRPQHATGEAVEAAEATPWAFRDLPTSWAPQNLTKTTNMVDSASVWPMNLRPSWTNPGNMQFPSEPFSATKVASEAGLAGAKFAAAAAAGPWTEADPDLWLPSFDGSGDLASGFQWEELLRDLGPQQFTTGF